MKKELILITIVAALLLIGGCGLQQSLQEDDEPARETTKTVETAKKTTTTTTVKTTSENTDVPKSGGGTVAIETTSGSTSSFQNMGDYRDNKVGQKCEMAYPFACSEYVAREGMLYLNLKYNGYPAKIEDVTVQLNDQNCDPAETYMEPGTIKEYTCYIDETDQLVGKIEISYTDSLKKEPYVKTGTVVANVV